MPAITSDRLAVSITEAAKIIGVTRPTVYRLLEDGTLTASSFRGVRRIPLEQIHALLGVEAEATSTV